MLGRKPEHETVHFACKVAAAGDERYLVCAAGAAAVVPDVMCSSSVFCNEWLCLYVPGSSNAYYILIYFDPFGCLPIIVGAA